MIVALSSQAILSSMAKLARTLNFQRDMTQQTSSSLGRAPESGRIQGKDHLKNASELFPIALIPPEEVLRADPEDLFFIAGVGFQAE
ncbi:MAG: hypothetical protein LBR11_07410 [Deltaproteobacteria bacterium]|jgi:hypothetical protein|nr:hypothetical protein [Deltaproteobacteria bacterium]